MLFPHYRPQVAFESSTACGRSYSSRVSLEVGCLLQVTIGSEDLKANHMIQQIFEFPQEFEKYNLLVRAQ